MNLPLFIARRYLFSKKERNAINVITRIAITGVTIGTMALVVVLSAFNGIENVVISLFNAFDPQIKVVPARGKFFETNENMITSLEGVEGVEFISKSLEEMAMLKSGAKQYIATLKGVDDYFLPMSRLDTMLISGDFRLSQDGAPFAVLGYGVAATLGVNTGGLSSISVYMPKNVEQVNTNPERAFRIMNIYPAGIFTIQHDFDSKYVLVPLSFVQELTENEGKVSALEIKLKEGFKSKDVMESIQAIMGPDFIIQDRFMQHDSIYKIMKSERLAVLVILSFILLIATFNIIGSVTMLIIEKKKDIRILHHLGGGIKMIKKIFFLEGMLITITGAFLGLGLGYILCLMQQQLELVKIPGAFVMDAYPVDMRITDFILIFVIVIGIGALTSYIPSAQIRKAAGNLKKV